MPTTVTGFRAPYRLLVVANEALDADPSPVNAVADRHDRPRLEVLVVAPAAAGWLERWTDDDRPRRAAEDRLRRCLHALHREGVQAEGMIGDGDSLRAIDDALRLFDADEVLVATCPGPRSGEVAVAFVEEARRRYPRRVSHVVADAARVDRPEPVAA